MTNRVLRGGLLVGFVLMIIMLYGAMFDHWHLMGDFEPHTVYIERIRAHDPQVLTELPNMLYHVSVLLPATLFPQTTLTDWIMPVCVIWFVLLALLILWQSRDALIGQAVTEEGRRVPVSLRGEVIAGVVALIALFVAPIFLLSPQNEYFGYMTPYVYHNPTMIPLRPIAVLLFIGAVSLSSAEVAAWRMFERRQELRIVLMGALTIASILAKPNFVMIFVPAVILWIVYLRLIRRHVDMMALIMGIVVPGVAFLGYQAQVYTGSTMAFRPFYTQDLWALHYEPEANLNLALKILASLAFPLSVTLLYPRRALQSPMLMLAWIAMIGGIMLTYLFYDTGEPPAGNLTWSGQIGVLILHLAALLFFVRQHAWLNQGRPRDLARFGVCAALLGLHVVSGGVWYSNHLNGTWPDVIYSIW